MPARDATTGPLTVPTGTFQLVLHKAKDLGGTVLEGVDFPMIETATEWVMQGFSYPNYLADLGPAAQSAIFEKSSVDGAMRDAWVRCMGAAMDACQVPAPTRAFLRQRFAEVAAFLRNLDQPS